MRRLPSRQLDKSERAALPEAVIRVCELAKDMHMIQPIPGDWLAETEKQFSRSSQSLQSGQLQTLADGGPVLASRFELTYAVPRPGWSAAVRTEVEVSAAAGAVLAGAISKSGGPCAPWRRRSLRATRARWT